MTVSKHRNHITIVLHYRVQPKQKNLNRKHVSCTEFKAERQQTSRTCLVLVVIVKLATNKLQFHKRTSNASASLHQVACANQLCIHNFHSEFHTSAPYTRRHNQTLNLTLTLVLSLSTTIQLDIKYCMVRSVAFSVDVRSAPSYTI